MEFKRFIYRRKESKYKYLITPNRSPLVLQNERFAKFCVLRNKAMISKDFVIENNIDILCLTETWLNTYDPRDKLVINEITPKGFCFYHMARKGRVEGLIYCIESHFV